MLPLSVLYDCVSPFFLDNLEVELRHRPRSVPPSLFDTVLSHLGTPDDIVVAVDDEVGAKVRRSQGRCMRKVPVSLAPLDGFSAYGFDIVANMETQVVNPEDSELLSRRIKTRHVFKRPAHEIHLTRVVLRRPEQPDYHSFEIEVELYHMEMLVPGNPEAIEGTLAEIYGITSSKGRLEATHIITKPFNLKYPLGARRALTWDDLRWGNHFFSWNKTTYYGYEDRPRTHCWVFYLASTFRIYLWTHGVLTSKVIERTTDVSFVIEAGLSGGGLLVCDIPYFGGWSQEGSIQKRVGRLSRVRHILPWSSEAVAWKVLTAASEHFEPGVQGPLALEKFRGVVRPGMLISRAQAWCGSPMVTCLQVPHGPVTVVLRAVPARSSNFVLCARGPRQVVYPDDHMEQTAAVYHPEERVPMATYQGHLATHALYEFSMGALLELLGPAQGNSTVDTVADVFAARALHSTPVNAENISSLHAEIFQQLELSRVSGMLSVTWTLGTEMASIPHLQTKKSNNMIGLTIDRDAHHMLLVEGKNFIPEDHSILGLWQLNTNAMMSVSDIRELGEKRIYLLRKG